MHQEQFISELLKAARAAGIEQAEAYYQQTERFRALVFDGELSDYGVNTSGGLSLRGLVNGRMGTAYTEALDEPSIALLVEGVRESAALLEDEDEQILFVGSPRYEAVHCLAETPGGASAQEKVDFALALEKTARTLDPRVQKLGHTGVQSVHHTVRIMNTHGLNLFHEGDMVVCMVSAIASQGERRTSGGAMRVARNLRELPLEEVARQAVDEAVFMLDAKPCESGVMPVIFHHDAMADLLDTFSGIFSAENTQKDLSLLKGRVGEVIAAPCVTLVDDPLLPEGLATAPFDDEGVATYRKQVIEAGTLKTLLHNLKTAKKDGVQSTGNAAKSGYAAPVRVSPSNFFFEPGADGLEALCGRMGEGLVITDVSGLHAGANAVSGDFSLLSKGYRVRGGQKAEPVEQITVAGNFYTLLKEIVAVGSDLTFPFGGVGSPSVWVKALSVAGR